MACSHAFDGFRLQVLDTNRQPVWEHLYEKAPQQEQVASLDGTQIARFSHASASYRATTVRGP